MGFRPKKTQATGPSQEASAIHYSSLATKPHTPVIRYLFDSCSRTFYLGWKTKRHHKQAPGHG
jgi:hypothetical protein